MFLLLAFGAIAIAGPVAAAYAESDVQAEATDETIENTVKSINRSERSDEEVRAKLRALQQQHDELEFRRRTGAPFRSERELRHDLRKNEKRQGWQKSEDRRLDYEITRERSDLRSQTQQWQRSRQR